MLQISSISFNIQTTRLLTSFRVFCLDGLFERSDVPEGQQEQDDEVALVLYRGYLKQQP